MASASSEYSVVVAHTVTAPHVGAINGRTKARTNEQHLRSACQHGHLYNVRKILHDTFVQVNSVDSNRNTALHLAVLNGHLDCVNELLKESDIDTNAQNGKGATPVSCAASHGYNSILRVLLRAGASPHIVNHHSNAPLASAAARGHVACVEILMRAGVNLNHRNAGGSAALSLASYSGHVECVQMLTRGKHINLNVLTNQGLSPLSLAATLGRVEVIECLLRAGALVNFCEVGGMTPLMMAVMQNRTECLPSLIRAGAIAFFPRLLSGKNAFTLTAQPITMHVLYALVDERDRVQMLTLAELFELGTRGDEGEMRGSPRPPKGIRRRRPPLFESGHMWDVQLMREIFGYVREVNGAPRLPTLQRGVTLDIPPLYPPPQVIEPIPVLHPIIEKSKDNIQI